MAVTIATTDRPVGDRKWGPARAARTAVFAILAGVILLGPGARQLLDMRTPIFRQWTMFSGVGVGILKGSFEVTDAAGASTRMSPLEVLELQRYPVQRSFLYDRLVAEPEDLRLFADRLCADGTARVAFHGQTGTRSGWRALDVDDVCALSATTASTRIEAHD